MYTVRIGTNEKPLSDATESWIAQHVQQRKNDDQPVCAQVILKDASVDMLLSTPGCGGGGDGGRAPNHKEQAIFALWNHRHLNQQNRSAGDLIAFLKQLLKLL